MFDLYLFDFDGLLVNTEKLHFEAYKAILEEEGFDLGWDFRTYLKYAHKDLFALRDALQTLFPPLRRIDWQTIRKRKNQLYSQFVKERPLELMEGVGDMLKSVSDKKLCVVTNSLRDQIDTIRERLRELDVIRYWITREDYENPKPAPDGYLKALELYADPGDSVAGFEDTLKGLMALKAANVEAFLVCPKDHPQLEDTTVDYQRIYPLNALCQV